MNKQTLTLRSCILAVLCCTLAACVSTSKRNPLSEENAGSTTFWGIPNARFWGDQVPPFFDTNLELLAGGQNRGNEAVYGKEHHYLAISGGGDDGAYGAGVLVGWTATGERPEFTFVTGVSTGAITAPFAFLGSKYDKVLHEIYTSFSTSDLSGLRGPIKSINGDGLASSKPMLELLQHYIDGELMKAIAQEFQRGRTLIVGTTNLDAGRPVSWNIGAIAASGHPRSLELIQRIILASMSVPVVFPPVYFKSEIDGVEYDEMHADGGIVNQVILYPLGIDWSQVVQTLNVEGRPQLYVIRNARLRPTWMVVKPKLIGIARRSAYSMIRTQGNGDVYKLKWLAERDSLDFHLTSVPHEFDGVSKKFFDPAYMKLLFECGYEDTKNGGSWHDEVGSEF